MTICWVVNPTKAWPSNIRQVYQQKMKSWENIITYLELVQLSSELCVCGLEFGIVFLQGRDTSVHIAELHLSGDGILVECLAEIVDNSLMSQLASFVSSCEDGAGNCSAVHCRFLGLQAGLDEVVRMNLSGQLLGLVEECVGGGVLCYKLPPVS